jgi:hypothetical protein
MKVYIVLGEHGGVTEVDMTTTDPVKAQKRYEELVIEEGCHFTEEEIEKYWGGDPEVIHNDFIEEGGIYYAREGDGFSFKVVESEVAIETPVEGINTPEEEQKIVDYQDHKRGLYGDNLS